MESAEFSVLNWEKLKLIAKVHLDQIYVLQTNEILVSDVNEQDSSKVREQVTDTMHINLSLRLGYNMKHSAANLQHSAENSDLALKSHIFLYIRFWRPYSLNLLKWTKNAMLTSAL